MIGAHDRRRVADIGRWSVLYRGRAPVLCVSLRRVGPRRSPILHQPGLTSCRPAFCQLRPTPSHHHRHYPVSTIFKFHPSIRCLFFVGAAADAAHRRTARGRTPPSRAGHGSNVGDIDLRRPGRRLALGSFSNEAKLQTGQRVIRSKDGPDGGIAVVRGLKRAEAVGSGR